MLRVVFVTGHHAGVVSRVDAASETNNAFQVARCG